MIIYLLVKFQSMFCNHSKLIHWTIFFEVSLFITYFYCSNKKQQYRIILKQAKLFWSFKSLRLNNFSVVKEPNWLFLHQCLISRLYMVLIFIFLIIMFLGKNWGQKLTKSEIICVNLWSFLCFWKSFGGMGSPASLFQHMWKLDNLLTLSYDCGSFDHFQKLFLVNFWSFFCWPCYC